MLSLGHLFEKLYWFRKVSQLLIYKQVLLLLYDNPLSEDKLHWSFEILSIILQTLLRTSGLKFCIPSKLPNSVQGLSLCSSNQLKMLISHNELIIYWIIGKIVLSKFDEQNLKPTLSNYNSSCTWGFILFLLKYLSWEELQKFVYRLICCFPPWKSSVKRERFICEFFKN